MTELKIIEEKQNPLFNRKEVQAVIQAEITPSNDEAMKYLSEKFSASEDTIKVKSIKGKFGSKEFVLSANIYGTKQDKDNTERKTKKELEAEKKDAEEKKVEEKSEVAPNETETPEAPKQETPKEEVKEETKTEEVTEEKKDE